MLRVFPAALLLLGPFAAFAQTLPSFEVASIKPAAPQGPGRMMIGMRGGPGTPDPGQITWTNVSIKDIVRYAYDVKDYQITGPSYIESERFDIHAKVPAGTTEAQARQMVQSLLAERFKLTLHHSTKEVPLYALVVAKNGPKLKEAADAPPPSDGGGPAPGGPPLIDKEGRPMLPKGGRGAMMMIQNGKLHMMANGQNMAGFVNMLSNQVDRPVVDMTELKGKYDIDIEFAPDMARMAMKMGGMGVPPPGAMGGGPGPMGAGAGPVGGGPGGEGPSAQEPQGAASLFTALQEQLGLKLEPRKGPVDLLNIDHVEKAPTEN
jgi:uncharacterized protein (TIGR03435 family)